MCPKGSTIVENDYLTIKQFKTWIRTAAISLLEMCQIIGGANKCTGLSFACGAGLAITLFTGGLGAVMYGPATGALR